VAETKFDICSRALVDLGGKTITAFDNASAEAKLAGLFYESVVKQLLGAHRWSFATQRQQLSRANAAPVGAFAARYDLPADCLTIHSVKIGATNLIYDRVEGGIECDAGVEDTVVMTYTFRCLEARFAPYFTAALEAELRARFAFPLTAQESLERSRRSDALVALRLAKSMDSQSQTARKVSINRFRAVRRGGR
jgi:hypothetical protein